MGTDVHDARQCLSRAGAGALHRSSQSRGRAVHRVLPGPPAAAQAAAHIAEDDAKSGLVTLDMGGTSADIAFIEGGAPLEVSEGIIARREVHVPALDMTSI